MTKEGFRAQVWKMHSRKVQALSGKARERAEQRSRWDRRGQNEAKTKCSSRKHEDKQGSLD